MPDGRIYPLQFTSGANDLFSVDAKEVGVESFLGITDPTTDTTVRVHYRLYSIYF